MFKATTAKLKTHRSTLNKIVWRAIQSFSRQGISLITFFLLSGVLSVPEFGKYNYVFAIITFLNIFSDFGISLAITKLVAEYRVSKEHSIERLIFNSMLMIAGLASVLIVVTLIIGPTVFGEYYSQLQLLLPLLFLFPATATFEGIYRGVEQFKKMSILSLINGALSIILILLAGKFYGLQGILIAQNLAALIYLVILAVGYKKIEFKVSKPLMRSLFKYALLIGIANLSLFFYTRIDILIMGQYGYFDQISYYEIVNKILMVLMMPFGIVAQVIAPAVTRTIVEKRYTDLRSKYHKYLKLSFIGSVVLTLMTIVAFPIVTALLPKYNSPELSQMFVAMIPVFFFEMLNGMIPSGFAYATGHASLSTKFLLVFGVVNVALDLLFINMFGFIGVIYSSVFTRSVTDVLFIVFYNRILNRLQLTSANTVHSDVQNFAG